MKITPKISIILPAWKDAGKYIRRSINSVIAQSYSNWELLIIDDGVTDNTEEIVREYINKDREIIYIKNESNLGIQKSLNKGLKEAKGEYVARIDDDDQWIDPDKLKKQAEFLDTNEDHVLVGTGAIVVDENNKELFRYLFPKSDKEIRSSILSKNCFAHSSVLFRKSIALEFGGYGEEESLKHIEDYDLWLKLGTVGKFANIDTYSVLLMERGNTISNTNRVIQAKKSIHEILKFKNKYPHFLSGYLFGYSRLFFFLIQKIIPINNNFIYKIKSIYKQY